METIYMPKAPWKRPLLILCAVTLVSCGSDGTKKSHPGAASPDPATSVVKATSAELTHGEALPGSYIVTFRTPQGGPGLNFVDYASEYRAHYSAIAAGRYTDPRVKDMRFLTAVDLRATVPNAPAQSGGAPYLEQLTGASLAGDSVTGSMAAVAFTSPKDAADLLDQWQQDGAIWFAEPNYISHLTQDGDTTPANAFQKYAQDYGDLNYWWLQSINLTQAFNQIATRDLTAAGVPSEQEITSNRPIVAVFDSGVDYEHPALKDRIWINSDVNAANCVGDVHGCDTTAAKKGTLGNGDVWPYGTSGPSQACDDTDSNCSHGTHVAGLIAADSSWTDPGSGRPTAGVCPVCQIMILKIVSKVGKESGILDSSIIAAFKYVALFRHAGSPAVRVINASFGKFARSRSVDLLIRLMKERNGAVLIGAAGNEDTLTEEFPAAFGDAIAVAAVDSHLRKDSFSNFGRWVDVAAPGSALLSTVPGGGVDEKSGTSMAAPLVAGVAGLMLARYPTIDYAGLRSAIVQDANPTFYGSDYEDGFNYNYYYPKIQGESTRQPLLGSGLLDANAAINRTPSTGLPLYNALDRVKPGCGLVLGHKTQGAVWLLLFAFVAPFATVAMDWRRRRRPSSIPY